MLEMILKHRDTDVLRFDWVKPFGVKNKELQDSGEIKRVGSRKTGSWEVLQREGRIT